MPGTFQTVTDGTFHSAMTGTFQSDTGGTSIPLLSHSSAGIRFSPNSYQFPKLIPNIYLELSWKCSIFTLANYRLRILFQKVCLSH